MWAIVCVYVYVSICICIYIYIHMYTHMYMRVRIYFVCVYTDIHICTPYLNPQLKITKMRPTNVGALVFPIYESDPVPVTASRKFRSPNKVLITPNRTTSWGIPSKQTFTPILPHLPQETGFLLDLWEACFSFLRLGFGSAKNSSFGHASRAYGLVRPLPGKLKIESSYGEHTESATPVTRNRV